MVFPATLPIWQLIVSLISDNAEKKRAADASAKTQQPNISAALLRQLQRKDEDAWNLIFSQWNRQIFGYLYCHLPTNSSLV